MDSMEGAVRPGPESRGEAKSPGSEHAPVSPVHRRLPLAVAATAVLLTLMGALALLERARGAPGPHFDLSIPLLVVGPALLTLRIWARVYALAIGCFLIISIVACAVSRLFTEWPVLLIKPYMPDRFSTGREIGGMWTTFLGSLAVYWAPSNAAAQRAFWPERAVTTRYRKTLLVSLALGVPLLLVHGWKLEACVRHLDELYAAAGTEFSKEIHSLERSSMAHPTANETLETALSDDRIVAAQSALGLGSCLSLKNSEWQTIGSQEYGACEAGTVTLRSGEKKPFVVVRGRNRDGAPFELYVDTSSLEAVRPR